MAAKADSTVQASVVSRKVWRTVRDVGSLPPDASTRAPPTPVVMKAERMNALQPGDPTCASATAGTVITVASPTSSQPTTCTIGPIGGALTSPRGGSWGLPRQWSGLIRGSTPAAPSLCLATPPHWVLDQAGCYLS